jgi:uncharacterized membrane protein YkoI
MNTKNLTSDKRLLAVILGVAVFATVGVSLAYAQTAGTTSGTNSTTPQIQGSINLKQMLLSSIQTKFTDAANTAAGAVTNGQVIGGNLAVIQGSVVYNFKVFDGTNIYSVIVDAGNGKVLNTSQGHPLQMGSLFGMGHSGMMHKFHMKGYAPQSQLPTPQQTQPQSDQQSPENAPLGT